MTHSLICSRSLPRTFFAALGLACLFAILTGCGAHSITTGNDPFATGGMISGSIHGGNQPVIGSTVQLWSVGISGYGSQGTLLATTTTAGSSAAFSFTQSTSITGPDSPVDGTYGCPTSNTQIYLLATGGNTGSGTNNNFAAIAALGPCTKAASAFVDMNEVTTVATLAAMQQFFDPNTDSFGSPSGAQAQLGLANAQTTIANLADVTKGAARTAVFVVPPTTTISGNFNSNVFHDAGIYGEAKINTIADIIAACVNSNGVGSTPDNCTTLFTNAVPQTVAYTSHASQSGYNFPTASDTVQAAYYILSNPTQSQDNGASGKLHNLFSLASAQSPFTGLTTQPLDWTIHIYYNTTATCTGNSGKAFFNSTIHQVAVDALGNIWLAGGSSSSNSLAELATNGSPVGCYGAGAIPTSDYIAIDPNGSIYDATDNAIYVLANTGTSVSPAYNSTLLNWTATNLGTMTIDPSGNVFYATSSATTATPIQEFPYSNPLAANPTAVSVGTALKKSSYAYSAADSTGRVFVLDDTATDNYIADLYPATGGGYSLSNVSTGDVPATNAYGAAFDSAGKFFSTTTCCDVTKATDLLFSMNVTSNSTPTVAVVTSPRSLGGIVKSRGITIDGAGNVWASMNDAVTSGGVFALGEVSNDLTTGIAPNGIALTNTNCTTTACPSGGGFQDTEFGAAATTLAIDPSGNVWIPNGSGSAGISEIVGQAVPVVTPIAAGPGKLPQ